MTKAKKQTSKKKCFLCGKFCSCKLFSDLKKKWSKCLAKKKCLKNFQKKHLYLFVGVIALGMIVYNFRSQFIVATVNGQPVFRTTLIKELESQAGAQVLDTLITKTVILQEAKKNKISISQEAIAAQIKEIEENLAAQNQDLDQILQLRNMTRKTLADEIQLQLTAEQLGSEEINISEEEINQTLEQQKEFMPKPLEASQEAALRTQVETQLREQKKSETIQNWLQKIREEAKINYLLFPAPTTVTQ